MENPYKKDAEAERQARAILTPAKLKEMAREFAAHGHDITRYNGVSLFVYLSGETRERLGAEVAYLGPAIKPAEGWVAWLAGRYEERVEAATIKGALQGLLFPGRQTP